MKKDSGKSKALAAGGFALGLAGSGLRSFGREAVADTDEVEDRAMHPGPHSGLVFANDYQPGVRFRIVNRIRQPTVNQILGYVNPGQGQQQGQQSQQQGSAVVDPTDWNGYIFNYTGCGPGNYNLVFLREGVLPQGQTYSFSTNAVFFSNELQLIEAQIQTDDGETAEEGAQETEDKRTTTEETATTAEETTTEETTTTADETTTTEATETPQEVIVNATETADGE